MILINLKIQYNLKLYRKQIIQSRFIMLYKFNDTKITYI